MNVSFFATCLADNIFPDMAINAVRLLEKCGCKVMFNPKQTCCGQPLANSGFQEKAKQSMRVVMDALLEDDAQYVVAPSGSCVLQIREYPKLFAGDATWEPKARALAAKTYEITDFIVNVLGKFNVGARLPGKAAYHPSCHMTRLLGVKDPPLALLAEVQGLELVPFDGQDKCCGFGGTFSVKMGALSGAMVAEKVNNIAAAGVEYVIGADAGCLMNIDARIRRVELDIRVLHVVDVLMMA